MNRRLSVNKELNQQSIQININSTDSKVRLVVLTLKVRKLNAKLKPKFKSKLNSPNPSLWSKLLISPFVPPTLTLTFKNCWWEMKLGFEFGLGVD